MNSVSEYDSRFVGDEMKSVFKSLKERGFQEWPEGLNLTNTKFNPDNAKFETIQIQEEDKVRDEILEKVEKETDKTWECITYVEVFEQKHKRLHIFLREKYCKEALKELVENIKSQFPDLVEKTKEDYLGWIIQSLEEGNVHKARVDYKQQKDKIETKEKLNLLICTRIFDKKRNLSPRDQWDADMKRMDDEEESG